MWLHDENRQNLRRSVTYDSNSHKKGLNKKRLADAKSTFFSAPVRKEFIELPTNDRIEGEDMVGKLIRSMYGTRDASVIWQHTSHQE